MAPRPPWLFPTCNTRLTPLPFPCLVLNVCYLGRILSSQVAYLKVSPVTWGKKKKKYGFYSSTGGEVWWGCLDIRGAIFPPLSEGHSQHVANDDLQGWQLPNTMPILPQV